MHKQELTCTDKSLVSVSQTKHFFNCYPQDVITFTKLQAGSCIYMTINIDWLD